MLRAPIRMLDLERQPTFHCRMVKSIPIKYMINTGRLLGVVLDKSRATLNVIISSASAANDNMTLRALVSSLYTGANNNNNNRNLTIQIPRDVVDNKKKVMQMHHLEYM